MTVIFILTWVILFVFAVRLMSKGWRAADDAHLNKVLTEEKMMVTKPPHPEMAEVKTGDELLVVKFGEEEIKDPLLQSLENRITELNDFDDEDDDGDILVRR